ncbi:MAG TPA: hypothetical protein VKB69_16835 [Micromonosporaceae bacterium]|nr:hypothetical protein [Micromonosporaceae bacterium]
MSTYVNMQDGPAQVASTALQLKSLAVEFGSQAGAVLAEIRSIEGRHPWGGDETGQTFERSYNQVPQGSDAPFSQSLRDELTNAGKVLGDLSDNILDAVAAYQSTDVDNSENIVNV